MLIIKINKLKKYHLQIFGAIAWRNGIVVLRRQISIRHVVSSLKTSLNTNYFQTHKIFYIFFYFGILQYIIVCLELFSYFQCKITMQTL